MKSAIALDVSRWSIRRWLAYILVALAVHVGLIWYFGQPLPEPSTPALNRSAIHLAVDPWAAKQLAEWPGLEDPTLFALPSRNGFSGGAWLNFPPMTHQLQDWTEPPQWLGLEKVALGRIFDTIASTSSYGAPLVADKPMPSPVISDLETINVKIPTQSVCRITGELAQRRLISSMVLPSWGSPDLLTNSVVESLVNADGYPVSSRLLGTSGWTEADDYALNLTREARFQPLPVEERGKNAAFTWGRLIFQWHSVPPAPAATNTVANALHQ